MSFGLCCIKAFKWDGTPTGRTDKIGNNDTYITGDNPDRAILFVHDLLGWTFPNARLLADHYAREADVTVYVPDFLGGEIVPFEPILAGRYDEVDLQGLATRHAREIREPEIFEVARLLRSKYKKLAAVGFCYGGWAAFRLGAKEHQPPLVDCVATAHPSMLINKDIDEIAVPVQILAPEFDPIYTPELKQHTLETIPKLGIPFDYQHFPGVEHIFAIRGDPNKKGERDAMTRAKNAAVGWFRQFLDD